MSIGIMQARPPFVEFRQVAIHDARKSEELGRRVTKDVDMAYIMQPGSKDCVEIKAEDWLASLKRKALDAAPDAFPQEWIDGFHKKYELWKQGHEAPLNGTSVREWPLLSPAEVANFIAAHILTIEDVAAMTEQAMSAVGMGSRNLREKAREWLTGKDVAQQALRENEELKARIAALEAALLEKPEAPRRGRPPKASDAEPLAA